MLDYSVFPDAADGGMFGCVEIEDEACWSAVAGTDLCWRWSSSMKKLMPCTPDESPVSRGGRQVFHFS